MLLVAPAVVMADIPGMQVVGNTIQWYDTGGWMQVQNTSTFETVPGCSGHISSCTVPNGEYHVIDHTNSNRHEHLAAPNVTSDDGIRNMEAHHQYHTAYQGSSKYSAEFACPNEESLLSVTGCRAYWSNGDSIPSFFEPGKVQNHPSWNFVRCEAIGVDLAQFAWDTLNVVLSANCTREDIQPN